MFQTLFYTTSALIPIKMVYPYDEQLSFKSKLTTFNDGFTAYVEPILYSVKDIQINRNNIFYLTSAVQLNSVLDIQSDNITLNKLENKFSLRINNKFVSSPDFLTLDVNQLVNSNASFFRFIPNGDAIKINLGAKYLTVDKKFPHSLTFKDLIKDDTYEQQNFDFNIIANTYIRIKTRLILTLPNTRLSQYLSYDPLDGNKVKAIGDSNHPYTFNIIYPVNSLSAIDTNFNGSTYWVKYFNGYSNQINNNNVEIDSPRSVKNIPVNFLISAAYKKDISSTTPATFNVNLNNLKNFQTPEYEYTDNSFYINKYQIFGNISAAGVPLANIPLSGFLTPVITNEVGNYSVLVDYDWSGFIIPNQPEYTFIPSGVNYTNVESGQLQNYTATLNTYIVSGTITLSGTNIGVQSVNILAGDFNTVTDGSGHYVFEVPYNWSGVLSALNITTLPVSALLTNTQSNVTQNFITFSY